ncbi:nucleotide diphosphatase NDAI_0B04270 [Naumovozyma dairenensis CBS 421]|uniref:Maf-like protein n=1 Tax=Naumovozyma dairenensis (strain ATCC 10597 / BCRC 20456 / CBS 421 / NBRC 0211 / NRRL Y-12639) TaxID=1071378 RepID=G0W6Q0_NAUDC|nr:hypothetical protein NDAI_0B04270 [Naumovozyma dairenensis CBS 421]CCD23461.1 hypothetical protein NDAI_0B04270 [Naumovozyma dairenensis CBS 421]
MLSYYPGLSAERFNKKFQMILGSSSPRRYEILHDEMDFRDIEVRKPNFPEKLDKSKYINRPLEYVKDTAGFKAEEMMEYLEKEEQKPPKKGLPNKIEKVDEINKVKVVICADTIVIDPNNKIYEKPITESAQLEMLETFCYKFDKPIRVATAVNIIIWENSEKNMNSAFCKVTELHFDKNIPKTLIEEYVRSGAGLQAAGGFNIQDLNGTIIKKVQRDDDYYNVMGLPILPTYEKIFVLIKLFFQMYPIAQDCKQEDDERY